MHWFFIYLIPRSSRGTYFTFWVCLGSCNNPKRLMLKPARSATRSCHLCVPSTWRGPGHRDTQQPLRRSPEVHIFGHVLAVTSSHPQQLAAAAVGMQHPKAKQHKRGPLSKYRWCFLVQYEQSPLLKSDPKLCNSEEKEAQQGWGGWSSEWQCYTCARGSEEDPAFVNWSVLLAGG